jgi:cell division protease FtsH
MKTIVLFTMIFLKAIGVYFFVNVNMDKYFGYKIGITNYENNLNNKKITNPYGRKYYEEVLNRKNQELNEQKEEYYLKNKYPVSKLYYEEQIKRLNSKNVTIQNNSILGNDQRIMEEEENNGFFSDQEIKKPFRIMVKKQNLLEALGLGIKIDNDNDNDINNNNNGYSSGYNSGETKSANFEVIKNYPVKFKDVGGYENVKEELKQCVDILKNYRKYMKYNVRIPKGLILEGPPGTGKTLLAKALAGEAECGFIALSGGDFQEKYVGVGSTRIKELFKLAKKNIPCVIFIDEIDAVGRKRSSDGESSSNERDSTLNSLLVELDGFKNNTGIFLVSATNRIDLLDNALTRPGRIDKKIFIGLPDKTTRKAIIEIHINGKPYDSSVNIMDLVEMTEGLTGAQIENLLNESMLNALRYNREEFTYSDFDLVLNKMMVGWQPIEHEFTSDIVDHITIHEMGHAIVGIFSKHHAKMVKVIINFSSPRSPGYTVFESSVSNIYTREALFEHLMILLSGRIAEELFYGISVTTGALNDFEEALKLAEKMVVYYGMGTNVIYPNSSDKFKEFIDRDVIKLINKAYNYAEIILIKSKDLIKEGSEILKNEKYLSASTLEALIHDKYSDLLELNIDSDIEY